MKCRKLFKRLALRLLPTPLLLVVKKHYYARRLSRNTFEQEPDLEIVRYLIGEGDNVIDIGANVGVYSVFLSRLIGDEGAVHAIEPVPTSHKILQYVTKKLGLKNVVMHDCAASNTNGSATMEIPFGADGEEDFYQARILSGRPTGRQIQVELSTIDLMRLSGISFIKCDVEGHEAEVVRGAADTIRRCRPAWLIEISGNPDRPGDSGYRAIEFLTHHGYRVFWYDGAELIERRSGDASLNYFFLTEKHLKLLPRSIIRSSVALGS